MTRSNGLWLDTRGATVSISHVLTMTITAVLVSGLVIAAGGLVDDQRERAAEDGLRVVGERLVSELTHIDQFAVGNDPTSVTIRTTHPDRVVGQDYRIRLTDDASVCQASSCLVLQMGSPDVQVITNFPNRTSVGESSVSGGNLQIVYNGTTIRLEPEGYA